jgi:hypothetical protein
MFGIEWLLAFIKVIFNVVFAIVVAIPFNVAWNCVATNYLASWLPDQFEHIPYWHMVAILLVCTYVGEQIHKLSNK